MTAATLAYIVAAAGVTVALWNGRRRDDRPATRTPRKRGRQ